MRRTDPLADPEGLIRRVYAYVAYRIGDGPDAEDVTAEALERGLRYRDSYDPKKGEPAAWLIGIARRVLASPRSEPTAIADRDVPSEDDVEAEALRRLSLRAAVARLSDRDRELVALRYGADLSAREIGALLDLSTNAAEVALHRALGRLRSELTAEPPVRSSRVVQPAVD